MKLFIFIIISVITFTLQAQNENSSNILTNKNGNPILPQAGDWAVGSSTAPLLSYLGNFFSSDYNFTPNFSSSNPGGIFVKYHKRNDLSYRLAFSIGSSSTFTKIANPSSPDEFDKETSSALSVGLSIGIEKYKIINGRLRAYYGIDGSYSKSPYSGLRFGPNEYVQGTFKYTNAFNSTLNFSEIGGDMSTYSTLGFIGIEYFIAAKISISGEYGMGARAKFTSDRKYNPESGSSLTFIPGEKEFGFFTDSSSSINLLFYF